jgi:hypothetical protein
MLGGSAVAVCKRSDAERETMRTLTLAADRRLPRFALARHRRVFSAAVDSASDPRIPGTGRSPGRRCATLRGGRDAIWQNEIARSDPKDIAALLTMNETLAGKLGEGKADGLAGGADHVR